jgi:hypothetical protein
MSILKINVPSLETPWILPEAPPCQACKIHSPHKHRMEIQEAELWKMAPQRSPWTALERESLRGNKQFSWMVPTGG